MLTIPSRSPVDGHSLYELVRELYPICRSITGDGVRQTLRRLSDSIPLTIHEVPSGTQVLDWTVPSEWNIRDAWIATTDGRRVVDFRDCNLHVISYSQPIRARIDRAELESHLHSLPERPDWIPYRTSYYSEGWGFCVSERQRAALGDSQYDVCIDTTLAPGHLTYGELVVPGRLADEVLMSAHVCHPSLANDNLSGIAVLVAVAKHLMGRANRYTYRILFAPGTIGALTWLALHQSEIGRLRHGLVVACLGDPGPFTYKRSRRGHTEIDRAVEHVLRGSTSRFQIRNFSPDGYDERQYCSPGFNLAVGRLTRTPNGEYPEYHTSADNLDLVRGECLAESASLLCDILTVLEENEAFVNLSPMGEPQLGRRGLYRSLGGGPDTPQVEEAIRWILNLSEGDKTLLDIAEQSGLRFQIVSAAAGLLVEHDLLRRVEARSDNGRTHSA